MYLLLWMNVVLDFFCEGFIELWETERERKMQKETQFLQWIRIHAWHGQRKIIKRPRLLDHLTGVENRPVITYVHLSKVDRVA